MNADEKKRFRDLADRYELVPSDFWKSPQGFVIISRRGIEKIQNAINADVSFHVVPEFSDPEKGTYVIKAVGTMRSQEMTTGSRLGDNDREILTAYRAQRRVETYGESNPKNTRGGAQAYPVAMAEKRALSRCILKLSDFYTLNVFGEDEIDAQK